MKEVKVDVIYFMNEVLLHLSLNDKYVGKNSIYELIELTPSSMIFKDQYCTYAVSDVNSITSHGHDLVICKIVNKIGL